MNNLFVFILSALLLLGIFNFSSCKEEPCKNYEVKIDTARIVINDKIPLQSYSGFDTLKFTTNTGDTITFLGDGLNTGYTKVDKFAEDRCNTKSTIYKEYEGYTFSPKVIYPSNIQFFVARDLKSSFGTNLYIIVNKIIFYRDASLGSNNLINGLIINGKNYDNVLKIYRDYNSADKSYIYYNFSDGIIQINFLDGNCLSKIK